MDVKRLVESLQRRLALDWERLSIPALVAALAVAASAMTAALIASHWQGNLNAFDQERIDRFGSAVSAQLAALCVEPLIAGDRIRLGALAQRLSEFPEIRSVTVRTIDDRIMATAGGSGAGDRRGKALYTQPIAFDDSLAGYVSVDVEPDAFRAASATGQLWLPGLVMLLASAGLGYALGKHVESKALRMAGAAAPPAELPGETAVETVNEAGDRYLLVANLFNEAALTPVTRSAMLGELQHQAERIAELYGGAATELPGTGTLLVFAGTALETPEENERAFEILYAGWLLAQMLGELAESCPEEPARRPVFRFGLHLAAPPDATATDRAGWHSSEAAEDTLLLSAVAGDGSMAVSADYFERVAAADRCHWRWHSNPVLETLATAQRGRCVLVTDLDEACRARLDAHADWLLTQPDSTARPSTL